MKNKRLRIVSVLCAVTLLVSGCKEAEVPVETTGTGSAVTPNVETTTNAGFKTTQGTEAPITSESAENTTSVTTATGVVDTTSSSITTDITTTEDMLVIEDTTEQTTKVTTMANTETQEIIEETPDDKGILYDYEPYKEGVYPTIYKSYVDLLLTKGYDNNGNAIVSPESANCAWDLYSLLVKENEKTGIYRYTGGRDFLSFKSNDTFKITNIIWANSLKTFHFPQNIQDYVYMLDMSRADATDIKNNYVAEKTNGFITSTPTVFTADTLIDAMNVVYFKDVWEGGKRELVPDGITFTNSDGSKSDHISAFTSYGERTGNIGCYFRKSNNAISGMLPYNDRFNFVVILPFEGISLHDVDVLAFMNNDNSLERLQSEQITEFIVPEFECENTYTFKEDFFGIPDVTLNPAIFTEGSINKVITQIAKIKVDCEGTEAAAVTEIMVAGSAMHIQPEETFSLKCDRPFIYYIEDTLNGDIAFVGVVSNLAK